jgi:DNA-binding SARP family transcriptional activator
MVERRGTRTDRGDQTRRSPRCATRFGVLGTLDVRSDRTVQITRASHRRMLSLLLLDAERRLPVATLIDRFWSDRPPSTAKAAVHTHMSALRHQLPDRSIITEGDGYRLVLDAARLDSADFSDLARRAVCSARERRWQQALDAADTAIALWRGPPFEELDGDACAQPEIGRLGELRAAVLETRAESLLWLGRAGEALPDLEWSVRQFPLREGFSTLLARARQQTGSHAEALRSLRRTERALAELGLEPSPALRALEQQILTHAADTVGFARQTQPLRSA